MHRHSLPLQCNDVPRSSAVLLLEEENRTSGSRESTQTSTQPIGIKLATRTSRETDIKETTKQLATIARLNKQVTAKDKKITELKANLKQTDVDHQSHLEAKLKEQSESHQAALEAQEASFNDRARQWEGEKDTFDCKLKGGQVRIIYTHFVSILIYMHGIIMHVHNNYV